MSTTVGQMAGIQDEIATKLKGSQFFTRMPIITEKQKDIENEIDRALGSMGGICLIVLTPRARVQNPNLPGPQFDDVVLMVRVIENVLVNQGSTGTSTPASEAAEQVAATLHHMHTVSNKIILCSELTLVPDESNLIYDVIFKTKFGVQKQQ